MTEQVIIERVGDLPESVGARTLRRGLYKGDFAVTNFRGILSMWRRWRSGARRTRSSGMGQVCAVKLKRL
jgi:hypothetical protein